MSDALSVTVFVGGCAIFVASLFHVRAYLKFKKDMEESRLLQRRAALAAYLPPAESRAEFAEVSRLMWARVGQSSPLYEQYQTEIAESAEHSDYDSARSKVSSLIDELAELEKTSNLKNPQAREELARLQEEIAKTLRRASAQ